MNQQTRTSSGQSQGGEEEASFIVLLVGNDYPRQSVHLLQSAHEADHEETPDC
jgi:hypothetical protein